MTRDSDLVLIGIGEAGYGMRPPTEQELADYQAELEERQEIAQELRLGTIIETQPLKKAKRWSP